MNSLRAADLWVVLSKTNFGAVVDNTPEPAGAVVVISGSRNGCGPQGPHTGTSAKFRMSGDGPLVRCLMNGHL
jgi:hypothetical protein